MNRDEISRRVKTVLAEAFELSDDKLLPEAQLYTDLDLDSLDAIDLAVNLKSKIGLELEEADLRSLRTIGDIVDVVDRKLNAGAPVAES